MRIKIGDKSVKITRSGVPLNELLRHGLTRDKIEKNEKLYISLTYGAPGAVDMVYPRDI